MKLSTRGEYGLRAMLYLATADSTDEPILVHAEEISRAQDIPTHYLKQILARLRAAGLVRSMRGPAGGHGLGRPAEEISVGEVVACLEGDVTGVEGVLAMKCAIEVGPAHCGIKEVLLQVKAAVEDVLYSTSMRDLSNRQRVLSDERILVVPRIMRSLNDCEFSDGATTPE